MGKIWEAAVETNTKGSSVCGCGCGCVCGCRRGVALNAAAGVGQAEWTAAVKLSRAAGPAKAFLYGPGERELRALLGGEGVSH